MNVRRMCLLGCMVLLGMAGCGWMSSSPGPGWDATGESFGKDVIPPPDGRAVLVLETFRLYPESKAGRVDSCYLRGSVVDGLFYPDTPLKVEGRRVAVPDPRPAGWTPGWVEFAPLQRHLDMEAVTPRAPCLHGVFSPEGQFYPDPETASERAIP